MNTSAHTQAVLLLTAHFSNVKGEVAPLTPKEWGRFALWLKDHALVPEALLGGEVDRFLAGWQDKAVTVGRIERLLARGAALGLAMERWSRAGLWVLTRADAEYPVRLKQHLKTDAPAILFGCGNPRLLNAGGVAVVGSRNAGEEDLAFSRDLGALAAAQGHAVVSGGARGVDEAAMLGALEVEGSVVGVMADSLLRAATSSRYRPHLIRQNLALITPYHPEAGFNAGNAMARNKYIYCLAQAAVVIHSGDSGGTWNGAVEALKNRWVPVWVKPTQDPEAGNARIVAQSGRWLGSRLNELAVSTLWSAAEKQAAAAASTELPLSAEPSKNREPPFQEHSAQKKSVSTSDVASDRAEDASDALHGTPEFYDLFLERSQSACAESPRTAQEIAEALNLHKSQVDLWLKRAESERRLLRLSRPVRYATPSENHQMKLF